MILRDDDEPRLSLRGVLFGSLIGLAMWVVIAFFVIAAVTMCEGCKG